MKSVFELKVLFVHVKEVCAQFEKACSAGSFNNKTGQGCPLERQRDV